MLKVGDKLLCKNGSQKLNIKINEYFTISGIKQVRIIWLIWTNDDNLFSLNKGAYYLWDYFYTPQEVRKMKLKQLNDESR